ncbi:OLC1v1023267C1 [Oldenlandia corymbosa var. corymbosa]|uniref:OLC1v1023267C1 n=1 Tax=Oldenlandia corymbosa var. corymbosa TaxID=529605 RepID=A0AAV1C222_OLDCO|nr:OLC1v1023267C1 [Oldenlandia corymbosa var. corymbosa]
MPHFIQKVVVLRKKLCLGTSILPPLTSTPTTKKRASEKEREHLGMAVTGETAAKLKVAADKYRSFLHEEGQNIEWRHGGPPIYDDVNKLFEHGRTQEWPKGSLEEVVQNAVKSWELELSHKTRIQDFRTINPDKFKLVVNGREGLSGEETLKLGSYNALLKSSMPEEFKFYNADEESFESSHDVFRSAFPRGFAWEVIRVYSGPPVITFKFRHWGYFEGPFKGHSPTGELVQFFGLAVMKVNWGGRKRIRGFNNYN